MTISSSAAPKAGPFIGNGVTTSFPFTFKVFDKSEVKVTLAVLATGAESVLVIDTNYTVTLNPDQNVNPGGSVTYNPSGVPMASTHSLTLTSNVLETQGTDITNGGGFYPEVIEDALDRAVILIKQLREVISRSLTIPVSSTASTVLPAPTASTFIGWNATATALINYAGVTSTPVSAFMATVLDDATASAALTTLGVSAFAQTVLDDVDAAAARATLGAVGSAAAGITGTIAFTGDISPAQIVANQNDYNPTGLSTASVLRLSSDASRDVTGLAGGSDGRVVTKLNIGSFPIVLKNENAGSAAANRFALDSDVALQPGHGVTLIYDSTSSRWRPMGSPFKRQGTTSVAKGLFANLASAASISIIATEIQLTDTNGNTFVATSVNVTPSLAAAGANGLDTGAEAANTWYYGWVIAKPDGTVAGLFSTSFTAPTMPAGYTFKAVVGAYRNDSGSNLINFNQYGSILYWLVEINVLNAGTATAETGVSLATAVPTEAADFIASARLDCTSDASSNVGGTLFLRFISGGNYLTPACNTKGQSASATSQTVIGTFQFRAPNNANSIFYHSTLTAGTAPQAYIWVQGFRLKGVGGE